LIAYLLWFAKFVEHRRILADFSSLLAPAANYVITLSFDMEKP
jgi:hypothetical protein